MENPARKSGPYDDLLDLPHHVSPTRPRMSMADRAAQFSPFAALTGYGDAIAETGRLTDARMELSEERLNRLNRRMQALVEMLPQAPAVTFTYFTPDTCKAGGAYRTITGNVKKVDMFHRRITLCNGTVIPMDDILEIQIDEKL